MAGRAILALGAALAAVAGCTADPVGDYLEGAGDPVRGAALYAPQNLGDTSRWAGDPAGAALAAAQLEFLNYEFRTHPRYRHEVDPTVTLRLQGAQNEIRNAIGITQDAPAPAVIESLRTAAYALRQGSPARAEAALSGPDFPAGPEATLQRLSNLPYLPQVSVAARAAAQEILRPDPLPQEDD